MARAQRLVWQISFKPTPQRMLQHDAASAGLAIGHGVVGSTCPPQKCTCSP